MGIYDTPFYIFDTETTGLDPEKDKVIEVAFEKILGDQSVRQFTTLLDPGIPIPPESSAIHHLVDEDVAGRPGMDKLLPKLQTYFADGVIVAHNASFDRSMMPGLQDHRWLCSYRMARHVWPDAPRHNVQTLRYWLGLKVDTGDLAPHRALADVLVTTVVFRAALAAYLAQGGVDDVDALIAYVDSPIRVRKMPFGEHFGKPLEEVPTSYLAWLVEKATRADQDLLWTAEEILRERRTQGWKRPAVAATEALAS